MASLGQDKGQKVWPLISLKKKKGGESIKLGDTVAIIVGQHSRKKC